MSNSNFKTLVHYVCDRCTDDPTKLGATKLNKILWMSDVLAYVSMGQPITEEHYIKRQFGPVAQTMQPTLENLQQEQSLSIRDDPSSLLTLYLSLKEPDISGFTAEQISLIDKVISWVVNKHSATSISDFSHAFLAWQVASIGEDIPHSAVYASFPKEIDEHDISWAKETIKDRLGT